MDFLNLMGFLFFVFFFPCILTHGLMNVFWSSQTLIFQSWPPSDSHPSTLSRLLFLVLSVLFVLLIRAYIVPWFQLRGISYLLCILGEAILDFWSRWHGAWGRRFRGSTCSPGVCALCGGSCIHEGTRCGLSSNSRLICVHICKWYCFQQYTEFLKVLFQISL